MFCHFSLAEFYFWSKPFHHTSSYKSIFLGKLIDLVGYYGPPSNNLRLRFLIKVNYNYLMFLGIVFIIFLIILIKVSVSPRRVSKMDILMNILSLSCGQSRATTLNWISMRILLASLFSLTFLFWSFNCSTLFAVLATTRSEVFLDYDALNNSQRDVFVSSRLMDLYAGVDALKR